MKSYACTSYCECWLAGLAKQRVRVGNFEPTFVFQSPRQRRLVFLRRLLAVCEEGEHGDSSASEAQALTGFSTAAVEQVCLFVSPCLIVVVF